MSRPLQGIVVIVFCIVMYAILQTPSGTEQAFNRIKKNYQKELNRKDRTIDSLNNKLEMTYIIIKHIKQDLAEAEKATKEQTEVHEKIIYRSYTNPERDSILLKLYTIGAANR